MRHFSSIVCVLIILAWSHPAGAFLFSRISLSRMVPRSDLIVRGRVLKVEGPIAGKMCGFIQVDRVLKGELQGSEAQVSLLDWNLINPMGPFPQSVAPGDYDLFFLKRDGDQLVGVNPYQFKFSVRQGNPNVASPNSDALEAVRSELLWSLTPEKVFSVEDERNLAQTEGQTEETRAAARQWTMPLNVWAVEQLRDFPPDATTNKRLQELLSNPSIDVNLRGRVIEALLHQNQPQALAPAITYIQNNAQSQDLAVQKTTRDIRLSLDLIRDPAGFSDLVLLLSHPDAEVRASAIKAIRIIILELKNPTTMGVNAVSPVPSTAPQTEGKKEQLTVRQAAYQVVPRLIPLLDDPDSRVRFQTILALAEITSQPGPNYVPWNKNYKRSDEEPSIAYWKSWWAQQLLKAQGGAKGANAE